MTPRRLPTRPALATLAALVGLVPSGCGLETASVGGPVNACEADGACLDGRCEAGVCVAEPAPLRVALAVSVDGTGPPDVIPGHVTAAFDLTPGLEGLVDLPRALTVVGRVRAPAGRLPPERGERVNAEVAFARQGLSLPDVPRTVRQGTFGEAQTVSQVPGVDYAAVLAEGVPYLVTVSPRGADAALLPPLRLPVQAFVDPDGDGVVVLDLRWPEGPDWTYGGRVLDASGAGVPGVSVVALARDDGRWVSSLAATGPEGDFTLHLDPTAEDFVLRVDGLEPIPTFTFDPRYAAPDFEAVVQVPALPQVPYAARVEDARGEPVEGVTVVLRARRVDVGIAGLEASFELHEVTGADGAFEVVLVPGTYELLASPPSSSPFGVWAQDVEIAGANPVRGQLLVLPDRVRLEGGVWVAGLDEPLSGARVQARAVAADGSALARHARSSEIATTDLVGGFALALDEGAYDVLVEPPSGSRFPWSRRSLTVDADDGEVALMVEVGYPAPLPGAVLTPTGMPVPGAEVAAYALVQDAAGSRTVPLGRAVTGADGRYVLYLPSR